LRQGRLLDHFHLSFPNFEDLAPIVDMSQNEVQVPELARPAQEVDAATVQASTGLCAMPTVDDFSSLPAGGHVTYTH
jgi:hypothetical protein